jgi:hypothetical protein
MNNTQICLNSNENRKENSVFSIASPKLKPVAVRCIKTSKLMENLAFAGGFDMPFAKKNAQDYSTIRVFIARPYPPQ